MMQQFDLIYLTSMTAADCDNMDRRLLEWTQQRTAQQIRDENDAKKKAMENLK